MCQGRVKFPSIITQGVTRQCTKLRCLSEENLTRKNVREKIQIWYVFAMLQTRVYFHNVKKERGLQESFWIYSDSYLHWNTLSFDFALKQCTLWHCFHTGFFGNVLSYAKHR